METEKKLLLYLLININEILTRNRIEYFTIAGTLLGMKRYGGFIPWDDDIDISILRENYEKTVTVLNNELPEGIIVVTSQTNEMYCQEYPKVCYVNKNGQYSDLSIDIFIWDKTKKHDGFVRFVQDKIKKIIYFTKYYKINNTEEKKYVPKSFVKQKLLKVLSKIKLEYLNQFLDKTITFRKNAETEFRINWGSCYDYRTQVMKTAVFTPAKKGIFEGIEVMIPNDENAFLTANYGSDYMTPPDVKNRTNHNVSLIGCEDVDMEEVNRKIRCSTKKHQVEISEMFP